MRLQAGSNTTTPDRSTPERSDRDLHAANHAPDTTSPPQPDFNAGPVTTPAAPVDAFARVHARPTNALSGTLQQAREPREPREVREPRESREIAGNDDLRRPDLAARPRNSAQGPLTNPQQFSGNRNRFMRSSFGRVLGNMKQRSDRGPQSMQPLAAGSGSELRGHS